MLEPLYEFISLCPLRDPVLFICLSRSQVGKRNAPSVSGRLVLVLSGLDTFGQVEPRNCEGKKKTALRRPVGKFNKPLSTPCPPELPTFNASFSLLGRVIRPRRWPLLGSRDGRSGARALAAFAPTLTGYIVPSEGLGCCPRIKKLSCAPMFEFLRNLATCAIKISTGRWFRPSSLGTNAQSDVPRPPSALGRWRQLAGHLYTACNEASRTRRKGKLVYTPPSGTRTPLRPVILCFAQHYATASSPIIRLSCSRNGFRPRQHQVILGTQLLMTSRDLFLTNGDETWCRIRTHTVLMSDSPPK